jgi:hypothetical protein
MCHALACAHAVMHVVQCLWCAYVCASVLVAVFSVVHLDMCSCELVFGL